MALSEERRAEIEVDFLEGDGERPMGPAGQAVFDLLAEIDRLTAERPKAERDFEDQRAHGWPDFHPEDFCHRCGRPNISWWTDSDLFNEAIGQPDGIDPEWRGIICPPCFVELSPLDTSWQLLPRERAAELAMNPLYPEPPSPPQSCDPSCVLDWPHPGESCRDDEWSPAEPPSPPQPRQYLTRLPGDPITKATTVADLLALAAAEPPEPKPERSAPVTWEGRNFRALADRAAPPEPKEPR